MLYGAAVLTAALFLYIQEYAFRYYSDNQLKILIFY